MARLIYSAIASLHGYIADADDELRPVLVPIVVGGGTRALPDDVRLPLELTTQLGPG